jgi:hypothetical protein
MPMAASQLVSWTYSCPLDEPHLWEALRYTELNPLGTEGGTDEKYPIKKVAYGERTDR